eukprot:TRINITY_DN1606_c0_g1_i4.p1 TRINITY_DN1606_c0_g1~~TRINITY_DN1606_c0_g1_i4.p1  ORF type:complete len:755 (+),score=302.52 TRINITY_DN1606_c0_g1_i4:45-2309(+)
MWGPLLLAAAALGGADGVQIDMSDAGVYSVNVGGTAWLAGGNTAFFAEGKWLSQADGTLSLAGVKNVSGTDAYGAYTGKQLTFRASSVLGFAVDAVAKNYDGFASFDVTYTSGVQNANGGGIDGVSGTFPSFKLTQVSGAPALGVMAWKGTFIDQSRQGPTFGKWPAGLSTGRDCGPHVLFDTSRAVVVSASSNFMTHSFASVDNTLAAGLLGSVTAVPAGYTITTMLSGGTAGVGINNEVQVWGNRLRARYGKTLDLRNSDPMVTNLGYNTDHGAYYYYKPVGTYADTLKAVKASAEAAKIPYTYVLLDSWFYDKDAAGGVLNWTAAPGIFYTDGGDADLVRLHKELGWPSIAHNRYWAPETPYAKQNGGQYEFSPSIEGMYVVPLEQRFWDDLMANASKWGMATYEQDWLYNEFQTTPILHESATQGRTWLMQMGQGAEKTGATIQYCMPYPRHVMQSLEVRQVTQVRASDDYFPEDNVGSPNWNLGGSSILAHAVGLAPFKDNFWTTSKEPNSSRGDITNPDTARHAAVATLTAGPVTPSDGVDYQNATLIMKSSRADGVLLHPARPATFTDTFIRQQAVAAGGPDGHVWSTYTQVSGGRYDIVFVTQLTADYTLSPAELNLELEAGHVRGETVAYTQDPVGETGLTVGAFSDAAPMGLKKSESDVAFWLHYTAPVQTNGWALLGEMSKWVPVSAKRFTAVSVSGSDLVATCAGSAGESITVSFAKDGKATATTCTFAGNTLTVSSNGSCM